MEEEEGEGDGTESGECREAVEKADTPQTPGTKK